MKLIEGKGRFALNHAFYSKYYYVELPQIVAMMDTEPERKLARGRADEEMKYKIEAAIMRILKRSGSLTYDRLVVETNSELNLLFKPEGAMLKNCLESLLDRDFIERSAHNR